ncbi:MAG: tetratricopeptide repeat protein [Maribacter sp.]
MDKYPKYISREQQELFERFLMNKMSHKEQGSFELRLKKNKDLQESFDHFKLLFETIEEDGLRSKLEGFHYNVVQDKPVIKLNPSKTKFNYRIAAAAAILLTMGLWFLNRPPINERLFDKYYNQDPGLPTVMGSNDNYDFYEAMVDYKQGEYDIAISKWEKLLEEKPNNDTLNYFLGVSHLANDNFSEAFPFLRKSSEDIKSAFHDDSNYHLGLSFLKINETEKALKYLRKSGFSDTRTLIKLIEEQ